MSKKLLWDIDRLSYDYFKDSLYVEFMEFGEEIERVKTEFVNKIYGKTFLRNYINEQVEQAIKYLLSEMIISHTDEPGKIELLIGEYIDEKCEYELTIEAMLSNFLDGFEMDDDMPNEVRARWVDYFKKAAEKIEGGDCKPLKK